MSDDEVGARLRRIQALIELDRLEDAREDARKATVENPDVAGYWAALASICTQLHDFAAVVEAGERALALEPSSPIALHALGPGYFHTGEPKRARAVVDQLVDENPEAAYALMQRAYIYTWTVRDGNSTRYRSTEGDEDRDVVRRSATMAVRAEPENPNLYAEAAEVHFSIGDVRPGAEFLESGLRIAPDSERLLVAKMEVGSSSERESLAVAERVLAANPDHLGAVRVVQLTMWRRAIRVAAVPMLVASVLLYISTATSLHGGSQFGREATAVLIPLLIAVWLWAIGRFLHVAKPARLRRLLQAAPLGVVGLATIPLPSIALVVSMVLLLVLPLREEGTLRLVGGLLMGVVVLLSVADMLLRVASVRLARRTGAFPDDPAGRFSADQYARRQGDGTFGRFVIWFLLPGCLVISGWEGGVGAIFAATFVVFAAVAVKQAGLALLRRRPVRFVIWTALAALHGIATIASVVFFLVDGRLGD